MLEPPDVLENGRICQKQIEEIVSIALQSLKTLMVDYETPIETRLDIALKIFEIFGTDVRMPREEIMHSIEKNAGVIDANAKRLSRLESLLELVAKREIRLQQEILPTENGKIIPHNDG